MANAPKPTYDSKGNLQGDWEVRICYDPVQDSISISWRQGEGQYWARKSGTESYAPQDLEDAIAAVQTRTRILGARRLF